MGLAPNECVKVRHPHVKGQNVTSDSLIGSRNIVLSTLLVTKSVILNDLERRSEFLSSISPVRLHVALRCLRLGWSGCHLCHMIGNDHTMKVTARNYVTVSTFEQRHSFTV